MRKEQNQSATKAKPKRAEKHCQSAKKPFGLPYQQKNKIRA